jgi:hypothetical protein
VQECIFNQVTQLVDVFVVLTLLFAVLLGWNLRLHPLIFGLLHDGIRVIAFVSQQMPRAQTFDEFVSLRAICCGT